MPGKKRSAHAILCEANKAVREAIGLASQIEARLVARELRHRQRVESVLTSVLGTDCARLVSLYLPVGRQQK